MVLLLLLIYYYYLLFFYLLILLISLLLYPIYLFYFRIRLFEPDEVETLLCGSPSIDFDDLRTGTQFMWTLSNEIRDTVSREERTEFENTFITSLFEKFLNNSNFQKNFLVFVMATTRPPSGGFQSLENKLKINLSNFMNELATFHAHTCFNTLDLNWNHYKRIQREIANPNSVRLAINRMLDNAEMIMTGDLSTVNNYSGA